MRMRRGWYGTARGGTDRKLVPCLLRAFGPLWLIGLAVALMAGRSAGQVGSGQPPEAAGPSAGPAAPVDTSSAARVTAEQAAAQEAALLRYSQAVWLVNMARSLAPAPPPGQQADSPLWRLDRRIVLLEAALRIQQENDRACLELYTARNEAAAAYRKYAQQMSLATAKAEAAGKVDEAARLGQLAQQTGRAADAVRLAMVEALGRYVALRPTDLPAWQTLLREKLALKESVEGRMEVLGAELAGLQAQHAASTQPAAAPGQQVPPPPAEKVSMVLAILADYHIRRGSPEEGRRLLRQAVAVMPLNRQAKAALLVTPGENARPVDYLDLWLTDFRLNPLDLAAVAKVGAFLARYGLYDVSVSATSDGKPVSRNRGALGFYEHEAAVRGDLFKSQPLPVDFLLQYAQALAQSGRLQQAAKIIRQAIAQSETGTLLAGADDPLATLPAINLPARILLADVLAKADKAASEAEQKQIVGYYQAHKDKPALREGGQMLAWLSWFHLRVRGDAKQAAELARTAAKASGNETLVQRSLGAALAASGDAAAAKEAVALLEPLTRAGDAWAAYYLAEARRQAGPAGQADALLKKLVTAWPGHPAGQAARKKLGADAPVPPATTAMKDLLVRLPQGLFDFYRTPGRYAAIEIQLYAGIQPFEPLTFLIRISNKSGLAAGAGGSGAANPSEAFPITVGDGLMVWPNMLASVAVQLPGEQSARMFRDYAQVHIPSPQIIPPGQWIMTADTIDVGPVEQLLRLTPEAEKVISFQFLVNPAASTTNDWIAGPGGYAIQGQFVRKAFSAGFENLSDLKDKSRRGSASAKISANRLLGSLLAEQQLASANRLSYKVRSVPTYRLSTPLSEAAADPDPQVRAFLADAVYPAGLSRAFRKTVMKGLGDGNWLVRLLTVRLVGDRIGPSVSGDVKALARDEDPLVRRMVKSYLDQWSSRPRR